MSYLVYTSNEHLNEILIPFFTFFNPADFEQEYKFTFLAYEQFWHRQQT